MNAIVSATDSMMTVTSSGAYRKLPVTSSANPVT